MRIGLAGVPGAGKSELADSLKNYFEKRGEKTLVIDDYVADVEEATFLSLGFDAAYVGNIHIALERAARERVAHEKEDYDNIITCGTLFETASYAAQSLEVDYNFIASQEEKMDFIRRSEATMRIFACFYIDLLRYDHVFHLMPLEVSKNDKIAGLELNLQSAFKSFNLVESTRIITEGSTSEEVVRSRLNQTLEVINAGNAEKQDVQAQESD